MNRRVVQQVVLTLVCALGPVLIPMSSWAQSSNTQSSTTVNQQDQTDRSTVNQDNTTDRDANGQQPPSVSEPRTTQSESQTTTEERTQESTSSTTQTTPENQAGEEREGLPATAGELPLLALMGVLSLAAAAGTRLFAPAKSKR